MEKRNKLKRSQSETNMESSRARLQGSLRSRSQESRRSTRESPHIPLDPLMDISSQADLEDLPSRRSSISTIGSAELSESDSNSESGSQTSGYTTESSYQTASGYERLPQTSSYASIQTSPHADFLREIHVAIDTMATIEEIHSVHRDLRELLTNEMGLIGGTNGPVIYLIAYNYM
ncbi:uncharacterized protein [Drosophila takahashii]|uniref:uncharacterized protein n=1 Tax=Drosophila takahashii TaxID=29030 RepID=UPI001CF833A1|nr:uncharacterized protein LOC108069150 [Drosophila takahashii]